MCLIHNIKADTIISNAWLKNIYSKNPDGMGCMVIEDGQMVVKKYVPKNFRKALRWFRANVEGRDGVMHWRYATHGAVNLDNAHPYPVLTKEKDGVDLYMMHNGVMDDFDDETTLEDLYVKSYYRGGHGRRWIMGGFGVEDDRSDTYHFIRVVVLPLVDPNHGGSVDNVFNPAVQALIASHIGHSNKLVFMDGEGRTAFINGQEFVRWEYYDLVCSNTYAWDSASSKYDSPHTRGPIVAGDPRKFSGTSTGWSSSAVQKSAILPSTPTAPTNPQSRWYENEIVPLGWDKIEADDDDGPDESDKEWQGAKSEAESWWEQINMTNGSIAAELNERDLATYIYVKGSDAMTDLTNNMWAGQMTDLEFVDEVLDTAHIARKASVA